MTDQRKSILRRDLNDLVRSPDGKVSEAKVGVLAFKVALLHKFVTEAEAILADWMIFALVVAVFVAPDLVKKLLTMRFGATHVEQKPEPKT